MKSLAILALLAISALVVPSANAADKHPPIPPPAPTAPAPMLPQHLVGEWKILLTTKFSTCPQSAAGDIRAENWTFNWESGALHVKVTGNDKTTTDYVGTLQSNGYLVLLDSETHKSVFIDAKVIPDRTVFHGERIVSSSIGQCDFKTRTAPSACLISYSVQGNR